jgi:hypothetical protein
MFLPAHEKPVSVIFILHSVYSGPDEQPVSLIFIWHSAYSGPDEQATTESFKFCHCPWRPTTEKENKSELKYHFKTRNQTSYFGVSQTC